MRKDKERLRWQLYGWFSVLLSFKLFFNFNFFHYHIFPSYSLPPLPPALTLQLPHCCPRHAWHPSLSLPVSVQQLKIRCGDINYVHGALCEASLSKMGLAPIRKGTKSKWWASYDSHISWCMGQFQCHWKKPLEEWWKLFFPSMNWNMLSLGSQL